MIQSLAFWGQAQTGQRECLHLMTQKRQTCKHATVSTCCSKQASNTSLHHDSQMLLSAPCFSAYQANCVMHSRSHQSAGVQGTCGWCAWREGLHAVLFRHVCGLSVCPPWEGREPVKPCARACRPGSWLGAMVAAVGN